MNSTGIRRAAIGILLISFVGFFFGGSLPIPLLGKFFLGAFGFGSGAALLIVANVLKIRKDEEQVSLNPQESQAEDEDDTLQ